MALGWREQYSRYRGYFLNIINLYKQRADLRAFTEVVLSIATITIFLLFALKPTALTIIALAKEINEKKQTVATLDQKISDLQEASTIYDQSQDSISLADTAVSDNPLPDVISGQVLGLAAKDSVRVMGLSIGEIMLVGKNTSTKKSEYKPLPEGSNEMPISINLQGDYPNLTAFLGDFKNLRIISKIDQLGINSSNTTGQLIISGILSARIPYLK